MAFSHRNLVSSVCLAPSGDNTQPWRLSVDESGCAISIYVDKQRDPSPMNAGQRMARIAVGAVAESLVALGGRRPVELKPVPTGESGLVVGLGLDGPVDQEATLLLAKRVTNRRVYRGTPISRAELPSMAGVEADSGRARAIWISDRNTISALARLIGYTDALMFGAGSVRRAFLDNVRFDRPPTEAVEEGLSLASLELTAGERLGLGVLGKMPDWLFAAGPANAFRKKAEALVNSASGICAIVACGNDPQIDFEVGRVMQRAWLELTARDFAVQPMMSLPVLESMVFHGHPAVTDEVRRRTVELSGEMKKLAGVADHERIAAILRFGFAPPPSGRTGRRPLESVVQIVE